MRSIRIDFGPDPVDAASAISDVQFALALLVGSASKAEEELAAQVWSPGVLAAAGPLGRIIKAGIELEAAITAPAHMPSATTRASIAAVEAVHMPSPATLATIAAVEAVSATMPSAATRAAIATVEATRRPKG
jgi:hypothetical protein